MHVQLAHGTHCHKTVLRGRAQLDSESDGTLLYVTILDGHVQLLLSFSAIKESREGYESSCFKVRANFEQGDQEAGIILRWAFFPFL